MSIGRGICILLFCSYCSFNSFDTLILLSACIHRPEEFERYPWHTAMDVVGFNEEPRRLLEFCGIDRGVWLYEPEVGDNVYRPLYEVASSKLALKTHVDMLNKVQINYYAAGLHREGSKAVFRYTSLELADRFALLNAAFGEEGYRV